MKVFGILAAALAIATQALAGDKEACAKKGAALIPSITQFCNKLGDRNMVPNPNAGNMFKGSYDGKHARLWMKADCNPKQWVPKQYCFSQFYNMCAHGDKKGQSAKNYGRDGCQHWYINNK